MTMDELTYTDGWHGWETDNILPFRWMSRRAVFTLASAVLKDHRYAVLPVFSEYTDMSQVLTVSLDGRVLAELPLLYQWAHYSVNMQGASGRTKRPGQAQLVLTLNKVFPQKYHPGDGRELGVRVGPLDFHSDAARHEDFLFFLKNALLNNQEMRQGKTKLDSFPLSLGIDIYAKCNISPHCVYCLWDSMKVLEGPYVDDVIDDKTLLGYGPFFKSARNLVNCSFGEPLLHPRFQEIVELSQRHGKILEIATNGQAFTRRTISALVGKPVSLYISLDAATAETYAKIRNDNWAPIVPNLKLLNAERKKAGGIPKIFMVFIPMRVNQGDLEAYFRLCQEIEADSMVLRPLLYLPNPRIEADRGGYHFNYKNELLTREELQVIFRKVEEYSRRYGVRVANQFNFGALTPPGAENDTDEKNARS